MDVAIAGGHGSVARYLGRLLAGRGDRVRGLIRRPEQRGDLETLGVDPVLLDLEEADVDGYREAIAGADAVVFAAGPVRAAEPPGRRPSTTAPLVDEVIVVDNRSTDGTDEAAEAAGARVIRCEEQGKGQAMRAGVAGTDAEVICFPSGPNAKRCASGRDRVESRIVFLGDALFLGGR